MVVRSTALRSRPAAGDLSRGPWDGSLDAGRCLERVVRVWADETLRAQRDLARTTKRAAIEARAVFAASNGASNPAAFAARFGDLIRSTYFLWAEAALRTDARFNRAARTTGGTVLAPPVSWPRALLLGTVATDLYFGYTALRDRARSRPGLVQPGDWLLQHRRGAARAFDAAAALGGLLIKAGQFASTRPDLLPPAYIRDLARLQDRVPPHPWPSIRSTIARELGRRPEAVFRGIGPRPVAAASLAQVHRARLRDGRRVAVKVQYPDIAELVAADLGVLERIVATIARLEPGVRLQPVVEYLRATLPLELDFRREAAAMEDLRRALAHRSDVLIPAVLEELTTERLLVMELVDGIRITDRPAMEAVGIDPSAVARLLNDVYAEQILRLGLLHGDPHPGNLLVQPGPRLVILDHGLSVAVSPSLTEALGEMMRAVVAGDFEALARAVEKAGLPLDERVDVMTRLQLAGVLTGGDRTTTVADVARQLGLSLGSVPVELLLVGRALSLLDGITGQLDPDLDVPSIVAAYS